jgi:hypothetical protein
MLYSFEKIQGKEIPSVQQQNHVKPRENAFSVEVAVLPEEGSIVSKESVCSNAIVKGHYILSTHCYTNSTSCRALWPALCCETIGNSIPGMNLTNSNVRKPKKQKTTTNKQKKQRFGRHVGS